MRPGDRNARQVQQAFQAARPGTNWRSTSRSCAPPVPGDAHPMIRFNDDDDRKPWKTDQQAREDDTQTVALGAAELQVTPVAWQARTGGSHAL